jgi:hypothetical protein
MPIVMARKKSGGVTITTRRSAPEGPGRAGGTPSVDGAEDPHPCRPGSLCETCRDEVRLEALQWLRDLERSYLSQQGTQGRLFSTMSSSVRMLHQCHPPEAYIGAGDPATWRCSGCGMTWKLRLLAEGYSFGASAGPYVWGEWLPEGEPQPQAAAD